MSTPSEKRILYDAFLSYHRGDNKEVETVAVRLETQAGLNIFLDRWNLVPGEPWQEELETVIDSSSTCVVFFGSNGIGPWQNEEMRIALDNRVHDKSLRVIPVLLPQATLLWTKTIPRFLTRLTWVEFRATLDDEDAFHRLVCGIRGKKPGRSKVGAQTEGKT